MNIQVDKTSVCAPSILRFEVVNAPSGSVFLWDVGKGSMYGADTLYTFFDESATVNANVEVTLPDNSTCQLSVPGISEIHALPVPEFVSSRNILCDGPDTVQFVDLTPNVASRSWIVDGTNYNNASQVLSHKFVSPGLKSLSLVVTDSNGCNGVKDFNDTIMVYPLPKFDFKADVRKGCAPESVLFNLTKDPAIDTFFKSYKWTFDGVANGTIQQRDSISLQYADAGDFAVTLEVAVGNGCEYTVTKNNFITLGDTAAIELLPPSKVFCENEMVVIKQSNTDVTGEIIWDFSGVRHDLISTSNEEARLIARDVGNLNISLSYNHNGCLSNVDLEPFTYISGVRAEFSSMDNFHCQIPHTVHLENNTDSLDAAAVSYQWRIYEEGSLVHYSTLEEPDFTFTKMPGQYDVELFAYGSNGCVDSVYKKKFIYQDSMRLIFDVNPKIVCLEQTVFTKNQTRPTTYVASDQFKWYFYDLNDTTILDSSDLRAPTFSYDEVGKYDMQVIGFNALGCSDTLRLEDIVEVVQPQLDYEIPNPIVCLGESIYLEGKTTPDRANFTHDWSLEKNNSNLEYTKKGKNSSVTPKEMGEYNAIYTHSIKGGCVAKDTTPVFVNGIVAEIELDTVFGCAPLVVSPQAIVTQDFYEGATEQSYEYNWTVTPNKGVIILGQDQARPTITFSEDRDYTVSLKITNAVGCIFKTKSEIVRVGVRAGFSIDDPIICFGDSLKVEDRSYNGVSNMTWSISPDFASQGLEYASRKYSFGISVPGNYTIKQVVTNGGECWDSLTRTFKDLQVIADFNAADSFLRCVPVYAEFLSTSTGADTCIWDFGLNESFKTISSSAGVIYQKNSGWTDGYDIQLIAKNKEGCTDTFIREDYIVVAGPVAKFEIENFVGCDPLKVQFKNESEDAKYSYFNYNDGSAVDSAESASGLKYHSYSVVAPTVLSQKILPSIIVYDSLGCGATYEPEDTVLVYRSPKAKMVYPNGNELCESESISFKDNGTFTNSRRWFLEGEEISTKKQDNTDALQLGDNELVLISKNSNNCSDTIADNVVVNAKPKIKLAVDDTLCLEQQLMFLATVDLDSLVDKIDWDFGEISRSRGMPRFTPSFIYRSPGDKNVKLKVSLTNGCSDSISKQIYVTNENNIDNPPIHFITFVSETEVLISFKQSDYHRFKNYILNDGNQEKKYFDRTQTELSLKLDNKPLVPSFYHVRVGDLCEFEGVPSDEHAFMILSVESSEPYTNKLSWTPYVGWDKVEKYIIHRQNDEGEYVNIGEVAGDVSSYIDVELCNRPYTYKIEAVNSNPAYYSFSYAVESAPIYIENPLATSIKNVSVVADKTIEVKWNASSFSEFDKFKVLKYENDFSRMVEEFYTEDTSFFDTDVYTSENSYIYQVLEIDRCGLLSDTGREGKSILLTGIYDERSILDWTAYEEWLGGVQTYALEIEKPSGFVPVYQNNGNITEYMDEEVYTDVSSKYCYRTYGVSTDSDTSYSNIVCLYGDLDVWIPTAFSPNSDGLNEGFNPVTRFLRAYDINELENYELTIYNRWGEKVFDSNNPAESWDGTYLGEDCQVGVYMYKVKITGIDKTRTYKNGTITLLR